MKRDHQCEIAFEAIAEDSFAHLQANVLIGGESLSITYEVTAKSGTALVLYDALTRLANDGSPKYDRLMAYVSLENPDTLAIKRIVPGLPKYKDVESAYVPWAHQVTPSVPCKGEIRIPFPAGEFNPYYPPGKGAVYRNASARQLLLVLEYAPLDSALTLVPVPGLGVFRVDGVGAKLQQLRATVPLRSPVPVKRRSDRFEPL